MPPKLSSHSDFLFIVPIGQMQEKTKRQGSLADEIHRDQLPSGQNGMTKVESRLREGKQISCTFTIINTIFIIIIFILFKCMYYFWVYRVILHTFSCITLRKSLFQYPLNLPEGLVHNWCWVLSHTYLRILTLIKAPGLCTWVQRKQFQDKYVKYHKKDTKF